MFLHYPHKLLDSLRFVGKLQYCRTDLYFNICILFVVKGGEPYFWFRRQGRISPNNWKVKPCAYGTADGFKLFIGTCRFQFAAVDGSLKEKAASFSTETH